VKKAKAPITTSQPTRPMGRPTPARLPSVEPLPTYDLRHVPVHAPDAGRPLSEGERATFEPRFGCDLSAVRIHESPAAYAIGARAYTVGRDITFGTHEYSSSSARGNELLAHELTHVLQRNTTGSSSDRALETEANQIASAVTRGETAGPIRQSAPAEAISRAPRKGADRYPWIGRVRHTYSAALRSVHPKDPADPHAHTLADLPEGDFVTVFGKKHGWLRVEAIVKKKPMRGWVSQELVEFDRWDALPMRDAMQTLKRAETMKATDPKWKPGDDDATEQLIEAQETVQAEPKYSLDEKSSHVEFAKSVSKIQISTIFDFILFVEAVEKEYPSATPEQVISEVRQLWFSDVNWELLVASHGIQDKGSDVDIETEPNPIAKRFDMADLAPADAGKVLSTPMGDVNIGHVLAGIDARLSGSPKAYPQATLKAKGHDSAESKLKYEALQERSDGDPTTFATFAGDLGQAYADYIYARYEVHQTDVKLSNFAHDVAKPEELRGDIHGYIAVDVASDVRTAGDSATGKVMKASEILRDLYVAPKAGAKTYADYLQTASGKDDSAVRDKIVSDSQDFAALWYAHLVVMNTPEIGNPADLLAEYERDFDELVAKHVDSAAPEDTLRGLVDEFLKMAREGIR
jgi:hypothetical protein